MGTSLVAIYGSPRRKGNTAALLSRAVAGARQEGARVTEFVLRDLKISPCLEIYGCAKTGKCVIQDDFHQVIEAIFEGQGLMLASPMFFYAVSAHTKAFMDRCQSLWVKKYWIDKAKEQKPRSSRKGLFISVGATKGKKLFDGALLSMRYFYDVLEVSPWKNLLYRGLDFEEDIQAHPEYLEEAGQTGRLMARELAGDQD